MDVASFQLVAEVIASHPQRTLLGRTRLQKTIKLLQGRGLGTNYDYSMHFYGPYSEGLRADTDLLRSLKMIEENRERLADGKERSVFVAGEDVGTVNVRAWRASIDVLANENDTTVLELAATYDAFKELGLSDDDAINAMRRKKRGKCTQEREKKMFDLLERLVVSSGA